MKFSVVVPIYNADAFLSKCLDSILSQTYKEIELILVNDGSTDNSKKICNDYASKYQNIIVIDKTNEGVAKARNDGLAIASGEYVYFIDPDDWLEKDCFLTIQTILSKHSVDILIFGYKKEIIQNNQLYSRVSRCPHMILKKSDNDCKTKLTEVFDNGLGLPVWNKVFNTKFLKKNEIIFPFLKRGQDMAFCCDAINFANRIEVINECYYHYQDMHLTKSNKQDLNMYNNHKIIWYKLVSIFYKENNSFLENSYLIRMFLLWFAYSIPNNIISDENITFKQRIKKLKEYLNSEFIQNGLSSFKIKDCNSKKLKILAIFFKSQNAHFLYFIYKLASKINLTYGNYSKKA